MVGLDDHDLADLLTRPPTTVSYDAAELGRKAARLLTARIEGDGGPSRRVILPTDLIVRGVEEGAA